MQGYADAETGHSTMQRLGKMSSVMVVKIVEPVQQKDTQRNGAALDILCCRQCGWRARGRSRAWHW